MAGLLQHFHHERLRVRDNGGTAFRADVAKHHQVKLGMVQSEEDVVVPHAAQVLKGLSRGSKIYEVAHTGFFA